MFRNSTSCGRFFFPYWCHLFLFFFLTAPTLSAAPLRLESRIKETSPGDYVVTSQDRFLTLLHIKERTSDQLIIEEISIARAQAPRLGGWPEWVQKGALGKSSHLLYALDLRGKTIPRVYSVRERRWLAAEQEAPIFSTLLKLPFQEVSEKHLRRIGPPPAPGTFDARPLWNPPVIVDGAPTKARCTAYSGEWPDDDSILSGRQVLLYLPDSNESGLAFFPYWIEVSGAAGQAKLRVQDSGSGMNSRTQLPPELTTKVKM